MAIKIVGTHADNRMDRLTMWSWIKECSYMFLTLRFCAI